MKTHSFFDSIYTRFLLQLLLLTLIPITLVILIFSYINHQNQTMTKYQLNTSVNDSIVTNINNNLEFTTRTTQSLLSSSNLISFLNNDYNMKSDYDNYISSIQNYVQATINADPRSDIYIYTENPTIPMSMNVFYHLSDISEVTPVSEFLDSQDIDRWFCESDFDGSINPYLFSTDNCFIYVRKAYDYRKNFLGLIVFSIPEKYFLSFDTQNPGTVIMDGHNRIINLTGDTLSDITLSEIYASQSSEKQIGRYLITMENPQNFPFTIITVTKDSGYGQFLGIFLLILGLFAILSILLCVKNLRQIVRQMDRCLTAMDTSISNNYKTRIPVTGNNEISHICRRINLLLTQASELSRQNVLKETSNKESRLIALQHQINPHFIYNTMEVFSSKMKLYGHYEESDAMVAFANIFRYNISTNDSLVTVREELGQMYNYLYIQKLRYPLITLRCEIPEELNPALIPKFTFQPLIENAIAHGMKGSGLPLTITVSAERCGDTLLFTMKDDGAGIPPSRLTKLNALLHSGGTSPDISSDGHSVGLRNVNTRLELYFGNDSRLTLASIPGEETCISFRIPYNTHI